MSRYISAIKYARTLARSLLPMVEEFFYQEKALKLPVTETVEKRKGMEVLKKGTKPLVSGINGETSDIATAAGIFAVYQSVHK